MKKRRKKSKRFGLVASEHMERARASAAIAGREAKEAMTRISDRDCDGAYVHVVSARDALAYARAHEGSLKSKEIDVTGPRLIDEDVGYAVFKASAEFRKTCLRSRRKK